MGVLDRFERRLDRLVNGTFARAFKAEVQPVEIASALQRECDDKAAIVARGRTIVPNNFRVELGDSDYERLSVYSQPLAQELADVVREHAGEQGYAVVGPITIDFEKGDDLETGMFRVASRAEQGPIPVDATLPAAHLEVDGRVLPITQEMVIVGRGSECDLHVDDPSVSRRHAMIRLRPEPTITDLGSTNGTQVEGSRIDESPIADGAVLVLGAKRMVFRYGG